MTNTSAITPVQCNTRNSDNARFSSQLIPVPIDLIASSAQLRPVFCVIQWYESWACCWTCRLSQEGTSCPRVILYTTTPAIRPTTAAITVAVRRDNVAGDAVARAGTV